MLEYVDIPGVLVHRCLRPKHLVSDHEASNSRDCSKQSSELLASPVYLAVALLHEDFDEEPGCSHLDSAVVQDFRWYDLFAFWAVIILLKLDPVQIKLHSNLVISIILLLVVHVHFHIES